VQIVKEDRRERAFRIRMTQSRSECAAKRLVIRVLIDCLHRIGW
jgi:hypothetical protein